MVNAKFIVKNTAPNNKSIRIFNFLIGNGREKNLLSIPGVTENDIRDSLLKGELKRKLDYGFLTLIESDIELIQFNEIHKTFLQEHGITVGVSAGADEDDLISTLADLTTDLTVAGLTLAGPEGGALSGGKLVDFTSLLSFTDHKLMVFTGDGSEACIIGIDSAIPSVEGSIISIFIPGGEAGSLVVASNFHTTDWDSFVASDDYYIVIGYTNGNYWSTGRTLPDLDVTAPALSTVEVLNSDADKLQLTFNSSVYVTNLTGLSLTVNSGAAVTITGLTSGNGTTTLIYDLSRDMIEGDDITFVIAIDRNIQDLNGNKIALGAHAVDLSSFAALNTIPNAVHVWRGDSMTTSGSDVLTIEDQVGTADMVASATRPTTTTLGSEAVVGWRTITNSYLQVDPAGRVMGTGAVAITIDMQNATDGSLGWVAAGTDGAEGTLHFLFWKRTAGDPDPIGAYMDGSTQLTRSANLTGVHDLILTWDSGETRFYLDGAEIAGSTVAGTTGTIGRWSIGRNVNGGQQAENVRYYDVQVSTTKMTAQNASDYHTWRLAEVGT